MTLLGRAVLLILAAGGGLSSGNPITVFPHIDQRLGARQTALLNFTDYLYVYVSSTLSPPPATF